MSRVFTIDKQQFNHDGFAVIRNYLHKDIIDKINIELDGMFNQILINGYGRGSIILNQTYPRETISAPCININTINLLELIIDIFHLLIDEDKKKKSML